MTRLHQERLRRWFLAVPSKLYGKRYTSLIYLEYCLDNYRAYLSAVVDINTPYELMLAFALLLIIYNITCPLINFSIIVILLKLSPII